MRPALGSGINPKMSVRKTGSIFVADDDEGEDWDELEKKAKRKDREGGVDEEERSRSNKKRRH